MFQPSVAQFDKSRALLLDKLLASKLVLLNTIDFEKHYSI